MYEFKDKDNNWDNFLAKLSKDLTEINKEADYLTLKMLLKRGVNRGINQENLEKWK